MERTAVSIAQSAGATAEFEVDPRGTPSVINDAALAERMWPVLQRISGDKPVTKIQPQTVAEDFSMYGQVTPSLFLFLGSLPPGMDPATAPTNHSPFFTIHEPDMELGVRAFAHMVVDYLQGD
jgi:metal-dependent amidase/aminoacylase/carboxypeptidase family protein